MRFLRCVSLKERTSRVRTRALKFHARHIRFDFFRFAFFSTLNLIYCKPFIQINRIVCDNSKSQPRKHSEFCNVRKIPLPRSWMALKIHGEVYSIWMLPSCMIIINNYVYISVNYMWRIPNEHFRTIGRKTNGRCAIDEIAIKWKVLSFFSRHKFFVLHFFLLSIFMIALKLMYKFHSSFSMNWYW